MFEIIAAEALFSCTFLLGKLALEDARPFFVSGYRTLLGSIILMTGYYLFFHKSFKPSKKLITQIVIMAFFYNYAAVGARFWGLQYIPIAKASLLYNMSPFLTALLSAYFFKHKLTFLKVIGLIIGFLGFVPVFYNNSLQETILSHIGIFSSAEIAVALASLSAVCGNMIFKTIMQNNECHFLYASSLSMFIGSLFHILSSLVLEQWDPLPINDFFGFLLWTTLLTLSSNVFSYVIYGLLLRKYTASLMSFAGMLVPVFSTLSGIIFLGEPFEWYSLIALLFISLGLYIFYSQELKLGYIHTKFRKNLTEKRQSL